MHALYNDLMRTDEHILCSPGGTKYSRLLGVTEQVWGGVLNRDGEISLIELLTSYSMLRGIKVGGVSPTVCPTPHQARLLPIVSS